MYDKTGEANEFVGDSVHDATSSALRFFGVEREELVILGTEDAEIYGVAGRTIIVAYPKNAKPRPSRGGDREGRGERGERGEGRRERSPRRESRSDDRPPRRSERRPERSESRSEARPEARSEERTAPAPETKPVESKGEVKGELGDIGEFVLGVVERLQVGSFEISENHDGEFLVVAITGAAAGELCAGDGRTVDALQLLANQAARQGSETAPRVVVDVEGNAEEREGSLAKLANKAAKRALDTGRAVALDPMDGRDRRMIHLELRERDQIATMSIGSGRYRQVVVVPEGAPEYDEAVESSRDVSS